jgi:hypothetical protein
LETTIFKAISAICRVNFKNGTGIVLVKGLWDEFGILSPLSG